MEPSQVALAWLGMLVLAPYYTVLVGVIVIGLAEWAPYCVDHHSLMGVTYMVIGYSWGSVKWLARLRTKGADDSAMMPSPGDPTELPVLSCCESDNEPSDPYADFTIPPSQEVEAIDTVVQAFAPIRAAFAGTAMPQLLQQMLTNDCCAVIESYVDDRFDRERVVGLFVRLSHETITIPDALRELRANKTDDISVVIPTYIFLRKAENPALRRLSSAARDAFAMLAEQSTSLISRSLELATLSKAIMLTKFLTMEMGEVINQVHQSIYPPVAQESDWEIIGVKEDCSPAELRHAYYQRARELHPDRLEGMDSELIELANEKLVSVNAAYKRLQTRFFTT